MKRSAAAPARKPRVPTPDELDARLSARLHRLVEFLTATSRRLIDWPVPFTADDAAQVIAHAPRIVEVQRQQILATVAAMVPPRQVAAVLSRDVLTNRWPFDDALTSVVPGVDVMVTAWRSHRHTPPGDIAPGTFPADVALLGATEWAHQRASGRLKLWLGFAVQSLRDGLGQGNKPLDDRYLHGYGWVSEDNSARDPLRVDGIVVATDHTFATPALDMWHAWIQAVVVHQAVSSVEMAQRRPFFAVDASAPHTSFWGGITETLQPHLRGTLKAVPHVGRIELLAPGRIVQLSLDLGDASMRESVGQLVYQILGPRAARHLAALERRLTTDGQRSGSVVWDVEAHLHAMGVRPEDYRHHRAGAIATMRAFATLELAVYDQHHQIRVRQKLISVGDELDVLSDGAWEVRGMKVTYASCLYQGVRKSDGSAGINWYPAPLELPTINEKQHPFATTLGMGITQRFQSAVKEGRSYFRLTGVNALKLAGIKLAAAHPARAWTSLRSSLDELVRIGQCGRWGWRSAEDTQDGIVEIFAADWSADRTLRGIRYEDPGRGLVPANGAELLAWRTRHQLTAEQVAFRAGVSSKTIGRAEQQPEKPLSSRLKGRLLDLGPLDKNGVDPEEASGQKRG